MDSKETSAQPKRYPLFSKEAMDCHATAGAVSRNDDKKVDSSASHNDSSTATILNDSAQDSRIFENKAQSITAPQAKVDSSFETMDCHALPSDKARNDDKKVDSSASHNDSKKWILVLKLWIATPCLATRLAMTIKKWILAQATTILAPRQF